MARVAGRRLRGLEHDHLDVAQAAVPEARAKLDGVAEARIVDAQPGAGHLDGGAVDRDRIGVEEHRRADHTLAARHADFDQPGIHGVGRERDDAFLDEVDVPDQFAGFMEHLIQDQLHAPKVRAQALEFRGRQGGQQLVTNRRHRQAGAQARRR